MDLGAEATELVSQLPTLLQRLETVAPWLLVAAVAVGGLKFAGHQLADVIRALGEAVRGRKD